MVATSNQLNNQLEEDPVYDVVIVVEKTANLVPYLDELKTAYLIPTLEHFNGGPPSPIDTGHDYNCTLYCLVTYTAGDTAPEMASECFFPTTSTHEFLQTFDNLQFIGGAGQSCSHVSEGLSTALQCLDEIKQLRYSGKPTQRHCILICNSPPYHITAEESQDYRGYNSEQLASMMGKRGVNLSIISPRKIPALQKLFNEACAGDNFHNVPQAHYAVDPRHLVLLKGFQLQERSISPKFDEKKLLLNVPSPLMTEPLKAVESNFKKPPTNQTGLQQPSPQHVAHVIQPNVNPISQTSTLPMGMQQPIPQSKAQVSSTMTVQGNMQQRLRQQQPQQQDPNLMMRQPMSSTSGPTGMINVQQSGPLMSQHMSQQGMNQQGMQPGFISDVSGQNPLANVGQLPMVPGPTDRRIIWSGTMEYQDRNVQPNNQRSVTFLLNCNVSVDVQDMDISTADWPQKLNIQLLPQPMLAGLQQLCKNSRQVFFHFPNNNANQNPSALQNLYTLMGHGFAGCVRFPPQSDTKIILLMYSAKKKSFIGLIPNDQMGIVQGIKTVVARYRQKQQQQVNAMAGVNAGNSGQGMANQVMAQGPNNAAVPIGGTGMMQSQMIQSLPNDLQPGKSREMPFQQQPGPGVDQKKMILQQQQQQQQQVQQQQMMNAHRAKLQQQQLQRMQMQQQQQQQMTNPQLRHLLINTQQQQQLRQQQQQQQLMLQQQQQQQMRGGNPQAQQGLVMGQQGMQGGGMGQMAPQSGQNFMDDFSSIGEIM